MAAVNEDIYPWATTIRRILGAASLPECPGETAYISSDYGGMHKSSAYETISVIYTDYQKSADWEVMRREVRAQHLNDGRRMAFKSLSDTRRQAALLPFLQAADRLSGVLVVLAVSKSVTSLCAGDEIRRQATAKRVLDPSWKSKPFERMLRVVHLISMLVGILSRPEQNIYWVSDQDELFANERRTLDLKQFLDFFSSYYVPHQLGEVGVGTTIIDESDKRDEDLNAIADLAAGAVAETVTALAEKCGGYIPLSIRVPFSRKSDHKADVIYDWIEDWSSILKKIVIVFDINSDRALTVCQLHTKGITY